MYTWKSPFACFLINHQRPLIVLGWWDPKLQTPVVVDFALLHSLRLLSPYSPSDMCVKIAGMPEQWSQTSVIFTLMASLCGTLLLCLLGSSLLPESTARGLKGSLVPIFWEKPSTPQFLHFLGVTTVALEILPNCKQNTNHRILTKLLE